MAVLYSAVFPPFKSRYWWQYTRNVLLPSFSTLEPPSAGWEGVLFCFSYPKLKSLLMVAKSASQGCWQYYIFSLLEWTPFIYMEESENIHKAMLVRFGGPCVPGDPRIKHERQRFFDLSAVPDCKVFALFHRTSWKLMNRQWHMAFVVFSFLVTQGIRKWLQHIY